MAETMKYIALLRGINVGGKGIIKMADLRAAFEKAGCSKVTTYIQSGNVVFDSSEKNILKLRNKLEKILSGIFETELHLVVRTTKDVKMTLADVPAEWKRKNDLRCYMAFTREPFTAGDVLKEAEVREGIDFIKAGKGVVYLSTKLAGLTKSRFTKLAGKKIYKEITIRNYTTVQKILTLAEQA